MADPLSEVYAGRDNTGSAAVLQSADMGRMMQPILSAQKQVLAAKLKPVKEDKTNQKQFFDMMEKVGVGGWEQDMSATGTIVKAREGLWNKWADKIKVSGGNLSAGDLFQFQKDVGDLYKLQEMSKQQKEAYIATQEKLNTDREGYYTQESRDRLEMFKSPTEYAKKLRAQGKTADADLLEKQLSEFGDNADVYWRNKYGNPTLQPYINIDKGIFEAVNATKPDAKTSGVKYEGGVITMEKNKELTTEEVDKAVTAAYNGNQAVMNGVIQRTGTTDAQTNIDWLKKNYAHLSYKEQTKTMMSPRQASGSGGSKEVWSPASVDYGFAAKRKGKDIKLGDIAYNADVVGKGIVLKFPENRTRLTNSAEHGVKYGATTQFVDMKDPELVYVPVVRMKNFNRDISQDEMIEWQKTGKIDGKVVGKNEIGYVLYAHGLSPEQGYWEQGVFKKTRNAENIFAPMTEVSTIVYDTNGTPFEKSYNTYDEYMNDRQRLSKRGVSWDKTFNLKGEKSTTTNTSTTTGGGNTTGGNASSVIFFN